MKMGCEIVYNRDHLDRSNTKEFLLLDEYDEKIKQLKELIDALSKEKEMMYQRMMRNQEEVETPILDGIQRIQFSFQNHNHN